mgnify:CR=1 FL=1
MKLADLRQVDDWYHYNEFDYRSAEELLQAGWLGFCGCGNASDSLCYVLRGLELIGEQPSEGELWESWYPEHKVRVGEHFKTGRRPTAFGGLRRA